MENFIVCAVLTYADIKLNHTSIIIFQDLNNAMGFLQQISNSLIFFSASNKYSFVLINLFQPSVAFHIKTSHLICKANQMTGIYTKCKTVLEWVDWSFCNNTLRESENPISTPEYLQQWCVARFGTICRILKT